MSISLVDMDKADVLTALYNASKPQGLGFLQFNSASMTHDEAESILARTKDFDYLKGRVMKINLAGDELDPRLYDRDNGQGAAERALRSVKRTKSVAH